MFSYQLQRSTIKIFQVLLLDGKGNELLFFFFFFEMSYFILSLGETERKREREVGGEGENLEQTLLSMEPD